MELGNIQQLLHIYENALGQKLNNEKTSIFFSRNTIKEFREYINSIVGISAAASFEKYLGLLALVGQSMNTTFAGIQGRVRKKLDGWKEKFISQAGKETLINAFIQSIPTYSIRVFELPKTSCKNLNSMMSKFWWGKKHNAKRVT